jgi:hypothetical protein
MPYRRKLYRYVLFLGGMLLPTCRAVTDATRERRYIHTCVRKSCVQRIGLLLLLAIVGLGTYSTAHAFQGPAGINDGIKLWLDAADMKSLFKKSNCSNPVSNDGQKVKCWKDRSGNEAHVTVKHKKASKPDFNAPTYLEDKIGGQPVLEFKKKVEHLVVWLNGLSPKNGKEITHCFWLSNR